MGVAEHEDVKLAATLADDHSPRTLRGNSAAFAKARAQLRRAATQLRAGEGAKACGTLDRAATILAGSEIEPNRRADYVRAVRGARRILA